MQEKLSTIFVGDVGRDAVEGLIKVVGKTHCAKKEGRIQNSDSEYHALRSGREKELYLDLGTLRHN